ncbi:AAA family ATPase [Rhizobium leguminosarum bv. viciae]|nr:AAA family ATPase [Rhizobium leguminosarum bv. viciae]
MTRFKEWYVPHTMALEVMETLNNLREAKRNSRYDTEQTGAHILAPSHSGKSHIVNKIYFSRHIIPEMRATGRFSPNVSDTDIKKLQKTVVYTKVPAKPTQHDYAAMLLKAFDLPRWAFSRESALQRIDRALEHAHDVGNELLMLDRFDQLARQYDRETMKQASAIMDITKNLMEDGWPIVLVGLPNARKAIENMQLKNRIKRLNMMPLKFKEDAAEFMKFLSGLEKLMLQSGIFDEESGLCESSVALRLYYASQGRLGVLCNIIRDAAVLASRARQARIERHNLLVAVELGPLENKICRYNPFEEDDEAGIAADCRERHADDERYYDKEYHDYFKLKKPRTRKAAAEEALKALAA